MDALTKKSCSNLKCFLNHILNKQKMKMEIKENGIKRSVNDAYHNLIKRNTIILRKSLTLKIKYAEYYFHNENYSATLLYNCLLPNEKYQRSRQIHDVTVLSHYKATLSAFREALGMISKREDCLQRAVQKHQNDIKLHIKNLEHLMDMIPGSKVNVRQRFSYRVVKLETMKYFHSNIFKVESINKETTLHKNHLVKQYISFVIVQQLSTLVSHLQTVLKDLKDVILKKW